MDMDMDAESDTGSSSLIFVVLGAALLYFLFSYSERAVPNLKHIPTPGHAGYLLSYLDALGFVRGGRWQVDRGYAKYGPRIFKIATLSRWLVVVSGTQHIEELRKAPEDEVSFSAAAHEPDTAPYLLGHARATSTPAAAEHTRTLMHSLPFLVPEIREEVVAALHGALQSPPKLEEGGKWKDVHALEVVSGVTARVVQRVVFGMALARDKEYTRLAAASTRDAYGFRLALCLSVLPKTLRSILKLFSSAHRRRRRMKKLVTTFVREQQKKLHALRDREPNPEEPIRYDLLSRILHGDKNTLSSEEIAESLLELSQTVTQMISMTFTHALYHLAAAPQHAIPMRKEIETVVAREGWSSRNSLDRMHKVDSFLKESMRVSGVSGLSTIRKTLTPFRFSDGTDLPADTLLFSAADARHRDAGIYSSPDAFSAFRFSGLYEQQHGSDGDADARAGVRFGCTTTAPTYLAWGYGRHACAGRFVAAGVMKVMLAQVVTQWDVRIEDGVRPGDVWMGAMCLPDGEARVLVKRR